MMGVGAARRERLWGFALARLLRLAHALPALIQHFDGVRVGAFGLAGRDAPGKLTVQLKIVRQGRGVGGVVGHS